MEPSNLQSCLYLCWKYHNHAQSFVLPWLDDWTETLLLSSSFVSRTRQLSIQLDRIAHSKVLLYVQLFKVLIPYYWFASLELPSMPPLSKRERTGVHQGHIFRAQSQGRIPQGLPSFHGKYSFIFCTGHATNPHGVRGPWNQQCLALMERRNEGAKDHFVFSCHVLSHKPKALK